MATMKSKLAAKRNLTHGRLCSGMQAVTESMGQWKFMKVTAPELPYTIQYAIRRRQLYTKDLHELGRELQLAFHKYMTALRRVQLADIEVNKLVRELQKEKGNGNDSNTSNSSSN